MPARPRSLPLAAAVALVTLAIHTPAARALPRFAARTGNECIQCHVNPGGGGMRNAFGRNVFERIWLPMSARFAAEQWLVEGGRVGTRDVPEETQRAAQGDSFVSFSGDVNEWLALGADFRAAYLWIRPDERVAPDTPLAVTNTFFLMQSDLYVGAMLNDHMTFVLDKGIYGGFETYALFRLHPEPDKFDLTVRMGHFLPTFGIREVEHQLFTRERVGFSNADRDTGIEVSTYAGPFTATVGLLNGTLGDAMLDDFGSERSTFEKAITGRFSLRGELGWLRGQVGFSGYWADNGAEPNPLFTGMINPDLLPDASLGVDNLRLSGFIAANLGRFTYLGELVYVRDTFEGIDLVPADGYASYQELSFTPIQGLDIIGTLEFMDPEMEFVDNSQTRGGLAVEYFPWPFTEFRTMVRRLWQDSSPTGGAWDVVVFTHLFM